MPGLCLPYGNFEAAPPSLMIMHFALSSSDEEEDESMDIAGVNLQVCALVT